LFRRIGQPNIGPNQDLRIDRHLGRFRMGVTLFSSLHGAFRLKEMRSIAWAEKAVQQRYGSQATYYLWKRKYSGVGVRELRELQQLREEVGRLKRLVADLSLDRQMLQEIVLKKL
jgi:putative transposase